MLQSLLTLLVIVGVFFSQVTTTFKSGITSEVSYISVHSDNADAHSDASNTTFPEDEEEESDVQTDQIKFIFTQMTISLPVPDSVRLRQYSSNLKSRIIPFSLERPPRSIA